MAEPCHRRWPSISSHIQILSFIAEALMLWRLVGECAGEAGRRIPGAHDGGHQS